MEEIRIDKDAAKRLSVFRKTWVAKGQVEAAGLLKDYQVNLSRMESGKIPISFSIVSKLIRDYHLNIEWLLFGTGAMQITPQNKPITPNALTLIQQEVKIISDGFKMLQINQENIIKKMYERMKDIEKELAAIKAEKQTA